MIRPERVFILLMVLLLITPLTMLRAQGTAEPGEVSAVGIEVVDGALVIDLAASQTASVRTFTLTSPDRLVFDIENSVLALDEDAETAWVEPMAGVLNLEVAQFSLEPPVVRVMVEITNTALKTDRVVSPDGLKLAVYSGASPFIVTGPGAPPASMVPTIERFWHEPLSDGRDRFVIEFSYGVVLPQIRIESPTILLLRFPSTDIFLPASNPTNFATAVNGNMVERMRAEKSGSGTDVTSEIRLTVGNTGLLGYTLGTTGEDSLELVLFVEQLPEPPAPVPPVVDSPPTPYEIDGGQIMVLASGENIPVMPDAPIRITRVQYQLIDGQTDRFYLYYEGGELEPRVQRLNYPTRLAMYFPDAAVILPASANEQFQSVVRGVITNELKVYNRVIEDIGPETQFLFYFPGYGQENVGFSVNYVDPGLIHIDFYRTSEPVSTDSPVEVNATVIDNAPVPVEIEEPNRLQPEVEVTEPVVETPQPAASAPDKITVVSADVIDGNVVFHLTTSRPMPEPEWVEFNYPERLGLRFGLSDVELLNAGPNVYSSYTHVRAVPLVRAIIKDRPEEQYTIIAFTLDGVIEEYTRDVQVNGNSIIVTLRYTPLPVVEEPVVTAPEIAPEPEIVPEPEEPEVVAAPPVVEAPPVIEAPVVIEPQRPVLTVIKGQVTGNMVEFTIRSSQPVTTPRWVSYHYPERIGLQFPLSDVVLLDAEPNVGSAYTRVDFVPLVRAIIKDQPGDQHTTITFTLEGSIEEYDANLSIDGNDIKVTFEYNPAPFVPEVVEPEIAPAPEPVSEVPVVVAPEPASEPVVVEEPRVEVEVPGMPAAPGEPPFAPVRLLPLIQVVVESTGDGHSVFRITTSEPMPMPEWVEYYYPDRLGLRFPLSEVSLLGETETNTVQTRIADIPIIRAITNDRTDQSTTITFTLNGSLDEFEGELDWNGTSMLVGFRREVEAIAPVIVPPVPQIEQEMAAQPKPETPVLMQSEETAPIDEAVFEGGKPDIEEPLDIEAVPASPAVQEPKPAPVEETVEEAHPVKPSEPSPEPQPVVAPVEEDEVEIVQTTQRPVEQEPSADFDGVLITGVSFEKIGDADIIRLVTDGRIEDWEINPINYPTKLVVRLPESRPVFPSGNLARYEERVDGNIVNQYVANATVSLDVSYTIISVYAHALASTSLLAYDVQSTDGEWALAVYPAGGTSPFAGGSLSVRTVQPSITDQTSRLQPAPVSGGNTQTPVGDALADIEASAENVPKLSMRLEDANIRDVLQLISEQAGLNISIDSSVQGTITISLTDVPLFELLDLLGAQMNFRYLVKSGVYIFADPTRLRNMYIDYWERWYIELSYADADQIRSILVSLRVLSNDQIQIYRGTGAGAGNINIANARMIITGEQADLERAYRIIAAVDQPPVMIQVDFQILNTSITDNQNMGFQFNAGTGTGITNLFFSEQSSVNTDLGPLPQGFDRIRSGTQNAYSINYVINYLVEEGYAELMNRSSLTVANNQSGQLFVGENIPYRSTFQVSELGRVTQRVATQSVGLQLNFRAHANPDGSVTMFLSPTNSNLLELTDVGPRTQDQRFATTVRVMDGEPFIIGGFIRDEERVKYNRFPFLSELPLLGHLFRNREVLKTRSELIFVFTPHIIRPIQHLPNITTDRDYDVPVNIGGAQY